jgi:phasin protein
MGKPPSRKQAKAFSSEVGTGSREENAPNKKLARPTRRSIVELTNAACRAAGDGTDAALPSSPPLPAFAQEPRRAELSCRVEAEDRSPPPMSSKRDLDLSHPTASGSCELNASDSTADMAVKIAKACQADALDDIKLGLNAALDYAAELARGRAASDAAAGVAAAGADDDVRNTLATEYRAEAVALMTTNMATGLALAHQLLHAKTSAEWIELASTHARMQCEMMLQQGRALRSLARGVTAPAPGPTGRRGPATQE